MIPSTKARTRQREQGALKDEVATAIKTPMIPSTKARTRQREQGALKAEGIDLMVMPEGLKGRLPR